MRKLIIFIIFIALVEIAIYALNHYFSSSKSSTNRSLVNQPTNSTISIAKIPMRIFSSAFENNKQIPDNYTCNGNNINPPLSFSDIPANTKSLVLIVDDPDAPMGTWVHWVVYNIQPATNNISENSVPVDSMQGVTSFGKKGYGGPCPPSGTHRYFFKIYAIDTNLTLDQNANKQAVEQAVQGHIIDEAELIGLYSRK